MAWKKGSLSPAQKGFGKGLTRAVDELMDVHNRRVKRK